ncbi:hypothetical protein J437_LFUL006227 [Ladona fulva]|uniref:Potassium channel domain-containing protein n=1 Tax=Ladona fulva TaxID=123851 RepID=A0A8K0NXN3_LADFU|nr:hypothetical protein J437_LFUL006227 [Ladona fulva]
MKRYGHIAPATNTGRAITIVYAIFGIPMFLILLADFGKLFTRGIKFLWAFVRRVYYTGSCKKVRRTGPVQEVMKGVQLVYDFATFRRPSTVINESNSGGGSESQELRVTMSPSVGVTLASPEGSASQPSLGAATVTATSATPDSVRDGKNSLSAGHLQGFAGPSDPGTPAVSTYAVDDEFNLPISVAIIILLGYIFVGATIYFRFSSSFALDVCWEEWSFFESFYFVFISMSTIGFGDYVPQLIGRRYCCQPFKLFYVSSQYSVRKDT